MQPSRGLQKGTHTALPARKSVSSGTCSHCRLRRPGQRLLLLLLLLVLPVQSHRQGLALHIRRTPPQQAEWRPSWLRARPLQMRRRELCTAARMRLAAAGASHRFHARREGKPSKPFAWPAQAPKPKSKLQAR